MPLVSLAARAGNLLPGALLDSETLAMLERGNTAPSGPLELLLGHAPRPVMNFVEPGERQARATDAQLHWLGWLLRAGIGRWGRHVGGVGRDRGRAEGRPGLTGDRLGVGLDPG